MLLERQAVEQCLQGADLGRLDQVVIESGRLRLAPILVGDTQSAQILDALPVAVYATDPEGRVTYYNQAAADFWGYRPPIGETFCRVQSTPNVL